MSAEARRDVFTAIADPTRREIIHMVTQRSMNLNSIAEKFEISRPAISNHIKILTECGMITIRQEGRERYCDANLKGLHEVSDWVAQYKKFWMDKLDSLDQYLAAVQAKKKLPVKNKSKKK